MCLLDSKLQIWWKWKCEKMKLLKKLWNIATDIMALYLLLTVYVWAVFLASVAPKLNTVIWISSICVWLILTFDEYLKNKKECKEDE